MTIRNLPYWLRWTPPDDGPLGLPDAPVVVVEEIDGEDPPSENAGIES